MLRYLIYRTYRLLIVTKMPSELHGTHGTADHVLRFHGHEFANAGGGAPEDRYGESSWIGYFSEQPRNKGCTQRRAGASITFFSLNRFREANANLSECTLIKQRARQSIVVTSNTELHRWQYST